MNFSDLVRVAVEKEGKQEALAMRMDMSPSALSKRINGEVNWTESEINRILAIAVCTICDAIEQDRMIKEQAVHYLEKIDTMQTYYSEQVETLKKTIGILINGNKKIADITDGKTIS